MSFSLEASAARARTSNGAATAAGAAPGARAAGAGEDISRGRPEETFSDFYNSYKKKKNQTTNIIKKAHQNQCVHQGPNKVQPN
jgi:hypothetical protein